MNQHGEIIDSAIMQPKSSPPPLRPHAKSRTIRYWRLANRCDDETATFRGGGVDLQKFTEGEHQGYIALVNEYGRVLLLSGHVEPSFIGFAGGGFKHGQHLAFDTKNNYPLANLFVSMLQQLGLETEKFASSTSTMRGLDLL